MERMAMMNLKTEKQGNIQVVFVHEERLDANNSEYLKAEMVRLFESGAHEMLIDLKEVRFCLLYTSPSPRDGLLSRMPSSA